MVTTSPCTNKLVIFFMLNSNVIKPMIKMDLPKALLEEKVEKVDLVVIVNDQRNTYINRDEVIFEDLKFKLEEKMAALGKYECNK